MKNTFYLFIIFSILFISCKNASEHRDEAKKLIDANKYEEALNEINTAIKLEPDSGINYVPRILIYTKTNRMNDAIKDWDKIVDLRVQHKKNSAFAHFERAIAKVAVGLNQEALSDINYFINNKDKAGDLSEAYLMKGSIFYKLNQKDSSQVYYTLASQDTNKTMESQALVGLSNLSKTTKESLKLINKAIELDEKSGLAYGARMGLYINLGKINEAYDDSKRAIAFAPDDATINHNVGQLFANYLNNYDSAIKYFDKAILLSQPSPENDLTYMTLGALKHRLGRLDDALVDFKKAEATNPNNDSLKYNFALLLNDLKRNTEALEKINKAINLNSTVIDYYDTKGTILMDLSSFKEAEIEYKKAIKMNPNFGSAIYNLAYLYDEQNDYKQAVVYYEKAVLLNFNLKATLVNLALIKLKTNRKESACNDLERAYKLGRTDIKPMIDENCK